MSQRTLPPSLEGMDPMYVEQCKEKFAELRKEPQAKPRRAKKPSKLQRRIQREDDAFHYGDGRRRAGRSVRGLVQLNCKVPFELKELVVTLAQKKRVGMVDVVTEAIYLLQEHETQKDESA